MSRPLPCPRSRVDYFVPKPLSQPCYDSPIKRQKPSDLAGPSSHEVGLRKIPLHITLSVPVITRSALGRSRYT